MKFTKKTIFAVGIGFLLCIYIGVSSYAGTTQDALSNGLIRLHVIANSDSDEDQRLKLKVRDTLLSQCGEIKSGEDTIDAVKWDICNNLDYIEKIAKDEIKRQGYDYSVKASFGLSQFPEKTYGNITLPSGEYQALRVEIGKGEGKNWWCVLFPPLCFVEETCVSVSEESQSALVEQLGHDVYDMVSSDTSSAKLKLKSYEIWQQGKAFVIELLRQ